MALVIDVPASSTAFGMPGNIGIIDGLPKAEGCARDGTSIKRKPARPETPGKVAHRNAEAQSQADVAACLMHAPERGEPAGLATCASCLARGYCVYTHESCNPAGISAFECAELRNYIYGVNGRY